MKTFGKLVVILAFVFSGYSYSPSDAAVLFLSLPTSPNQFSLGGSGVDIPLYDPFSFLGALFFE